MACKSSTANDDAAEIAHVKLALSDNARFLRVNVTATGNAVERGGDTNWDQAAQATLVLNARAQSTPEWLESTVQNALRQAGEQLGVDVRLDTLQCFSPSYPRPPTVSVLK